MSGRADRTSGNGEFEALALPQLDCLLRAAQALAGNEHDARDLVQAACVKGLENFARFERGSNFKAWMIRIMRNTWLDKLRHRKIAGPQLTIEEHLLPAPVEVTTADEDGGAGYGAGDFGAMLERFSDATVIGTLLELPEMQRMALFLSDVEGMSQDEVAEVLGVAVGTVKSRISRARAALREKLENYARDMGFLERRPCRT